MSFLSGLKRLFRRTVVVSDHELQAIRRENAENGSYVEVIDPIDPIYDAQKLGNMGTSNSVVGAEYALEMAKVDEAARAAEVSNAQEARRRDS